MKNLKIILVIILAIGSLNGMSQSQLETSSNRGFSLILGYAPYKSFTIKAPGPDIFYPNGYRIGFEVQLSNKTSIGTGFGYKTKEVKRSTIIFGTPFYFWEETVNNYRYFNVPINLKYRITNHSSIFGVFGSFGFTNSFYNYKAIGSSSFIDDINIDQSMYELYFSLGIGLDYKLFDRISFVLQPNLGYALVSDYDRFMMYEILIGFKYKII